ncbi:MAG: DivIVA domain-containing protein, partial [Pseudonocardiaceae bacterium]
TSPGGDHNLQATKVLGLAQEMADQLRGEAKADADGMVSQARANSERLLYEARSKADGLVREARTRADTMLNEARARAEALEGQCREKVASVERDAARKQTEINAALSQEKNSLEKKIDELRALEREYRTRLRTYLSSQLRSLDGGGSVASPVPIRHRRDSVAPEAGAYAEAGSPDSPKQFNLFAT